jgi:elongation factor Ts
MTITTEDIKALRDETGVSIMQCKKALEEAGGDMEKARMILRKNSASAASKKSERSLGAGIVGSYVHSNKKIGAMVELFCETDFVAQNPEFITMANDLAMHITAMAPEFTKSSDIDEVSTAKATAFFQEELAKTDKPADIKEKILQGKLNDFFAEKTLMNQPFVKNPEVTIEQLMNQLIQKTGEKIEIGKFSRISTL